MKRSFVLSMVICGLAVLVLSGCFAYAPMVAAAVPASGICTPECDAGLAKTPDSDPFGAVRTPTPLGLPTTEGCTAKSGRVIRHTLKVEDYDDPFYVRVYQPPCYEKETVGPGYPVLLMLHGQSYNEDQWERLGVVKTADQLILNGEAPPFLIVMPRESNFLADPKEAVFGEEVVNGILPWVDDHYNTCTLRACRAIGGLSRGAAWAVREGFKEWETFGVIGAHSLPPFRGDIYSLPYWLAVFPSAERPRLYLDIGIEDRYFDAAVMFEAALTDRRVPHEWHLNPGGHNEAYWSAQVEDYLRWYSAGWSE